MFEVWFIYVILVGKSTNIYYNDIAYYRLRSLWPHCS
jgi:hypothetical protein